MSEVKWRMLVTMLETIGRFIITLSQVGQEEKDQAAEAWEQVCDLARGAR